MRKLEIKRDLDFPSGRRPGSSMGRDRRFSLVLDSESMRQVRKKHNQKSPNVKIEVERSLGPRGIKLWQKERRVLQVNYLVWLILQVTEPFYVLTISMSVSLCYPILVFQGGSIGGNWVH